MELISLNKKEKPDILLFFFPQTFMYQEKTMWVYDEKMAVYK